MTRLLTVALLFGLMAGLSVLHAPSEGPINPATMAALGFVILAAHTLSELAEHVHLPHITGYLLTGVLCGPYFIGIISPGMVEDLKLFNDLAVALIALSAGAALKLERLRESLKLVMGVLFAQFGVILPLIMALIVALSGVIPGVQIEFLEGQGWGPVFAAAICLAVIASAQSPAATIAILDETGAEGKVSETVLGVSVLNNIVVVVLFAVGMALASSLAPEWTAGAHGGGHGDGHGHSLALDLLLQIGGAAAMGALLGFLLHLYIRWVNTELLLLLAGLSFTLTWLATQMGVDPVLSFIAAGFTVQNFTPSGPILSRAVSVLSLPVYVVFFFTAGAGIHLDALQAMWPFALALFVTRMFGLYAGTAVGVQLTRGPASLQRVGWMGFGAQAGIALSMAIAVGHSFGEVGLALETLAVAGVALNELTGPVLLKLSLGLAGELPQSKESPEETDSSGSDLIEETSWALPPELMETQLGPDLRRLQEEMRRFSQDLAHQLGERRRRLGRVHTELLRREFLHFQGAALALSREQGLSGEERRGQLLQLQTQLYQRVESALLDRAHRADFSSEQQALQTLLEALESWIPTEQPLLDIPLSTTQREELLEEQSALGFLPSTRFALSLMSMRGRRRVEVSTIHRYHLQGELLPRILGVWGVLLSSERFLAGEARGVLARHTRSLERLGFQGERGSWIGVLEEAGRELREDLEQLQLQLDHRHREVREELLRVLSRSLRDLGWSLSWAGSPRLPASQRRLNRIFGPRQEALRQLEEALQSEGQWTRGVSKVLTMELQVALLRQHLRWSLGSLELELERGQELELRPPLEATQEALAELPDQIELLLRSDRDSLQLKESLAPLFSPLWSALEGLIEAISKQSEALRTRALIEPLLSSLDEQLDGLTERLQIPPSRPQGSDMLGAPQLRVLEFRALVRQWVEAELRPGLSREVEAHFSTLQELVRDLDALRRGAQFSLELAESELDLRDAAPIREALQDTLREVLQQGLARSLGIYEPCQERLLGLRESFLARMRETLLQPLERLEGYFIEGRWAELEDHLGQARREAQARDLRGYLSHQLRAAGQRLGALQEPSGWMDQEGEEGASSRQVLLPIQVPEIRADLPITYRHLFSDMSLETGELLAPVASALNTLREALHSARGARGRVALLGAGGLGTPALRRSLLRGLVGERERVTLSWTRPLAEGESPLEGLEALTEPSVVLLEGLAWLAEPGPGGSEAARTLLEGLLEHPEHAYILSLPAQQWDWLRSFLPLERLFPAQLRLPPLSREALQEAILARQRLSGLSLKFIDSQGDRGPLDRDWLGGEQEGRYFSALHAESRGHLPEALRLWLASIRRLDRDGDSVHPEQPPSLPLEALEALDHQSLLILRSVLRQGWTRAESLARQFQCSPLEARAQLQRLQAMLLLQGSEDALELHPELQGSVEICLKERGWL